MAKRELYSGGELDSVRVRMGVGVVNSGRRDTAYSACSLEAKDITVYELPFRGVDQGPTTCPIGETIWMTHFLGTWASSSIGESLKLTDINGRPNLRIWCSGPFMVSVQQNTSVTTTPVWETVVSRAQSPESYVTVGFFTGSEKLVKLYVNGEFVAQGNVSNVGTGGYDCATFGPAGNSASSIFGSQFLITENIPTIGARVATIKATANGAMQQMTGGYANLIGTAINDTTAVVADAVGEVSTFAYQDITVPSGMQLGEFWMWQRVISDGEEPANLQSACRASSTNLFTSNLSGVDVGSNQVAARWPVNPHTSQKWTAVALNACEFGMKAVP